MIGFLLFVLFFCHREVSCAVASIPSLLLANQNDVRLIPLNGTNQPRIVASKLYQAAACDYVYEDNLVFWIDGLDYKKGRIQYANLTYSHPKKATAVSSGMEQPDGLACDWIGRKIYWTHAETNRIEVSELDGSSRKVLLWGRLDQPRAIAVDPHNAYMYWTDWGEMPKIERAGMDGSHRQVLVRHNIYWPNGITIDYDEGKVYWVEANFHFIHRMNLDGTDREEVLDQSSISSPVNQPFPQPITTAPLNLPPPHNDVSDNNVQKTKTLEHPFAITLLDEWVYWTDWVTYSIHRARKNGSGVPDVMQSGLSPMDLQVYSPKRQKPGRNPCGNDNGGCSHLCLLSPDPPFFRCACPTGVKMLLDNKTCKDGPSEILLLARRSDLRFISLDTDDYSDVLIPVNSVRHAVAVDFDPVDKYVYWTDDEQHAILRAHLNGSGSEMVISHSVEQSDGIAIDWIARNLYWTDTGRNYISVSRLNGSSSKVLIETDIDEPRAIVLDPVVGHFYWSDWGDRPKIERANLDGTDRFPFVIDDVTWPNGLAIDCNNRILFWADAQNDRIEMMYLNGTGRKVLLSDEIPHIFGLSLLGNYLYWTDWQRRQIERMRVGNRRSRRVVIDQLPDIYGVKAVSMSVAPGTNKCALNNGGCSHLCLYTPQGPKCHCPPGLVLSDSRLHCDVPEAFLLCSFTNIEGVQEFSLGSARGGKAVGFDVGVDPSFLDFSIADDQIYWTDIKKKTIMRSYLNGSRVERFVDTGIELLEGIAIDWVGRSVYWADSSSNRIEMARMDRPARKLVAWKGIISPRCLAVDPVSGYMYWSEWGSEPSIKRAEMDGSNVIRISNGTSGRANSLTIDYHAQRLYWVDFDINTILSSDVNGRDVFDVVKGGAVKSISSLTLYGEFVYWSDSNRRLIERANKNTGGDEYVIASDLNDVDDIMVYHATRQVGVTSCSHDNGGCEYFCISLPLGRHTCSCPDHYSLNSDGRSCSSPSNFLLMSQSRFITSLIFQLPGSNQSVVPSKRARSRYRPSPDTALPVSGIKDACSIDYDPIGDRLYWLDCGSKEIRSSRSNGTEMRVLLHGNNTYRPYDIAVDPYSMMLFWTDVVTSSINAIWLNGSKVGTVLSGSVTIPGKSRPIYVMPRKIAVDPMNGRLYFSNACPTSQCRTMIIQSALDGADCDIFFSNNLQNVTALTVDSKRLYWADRGKIESSSLDGSNRMILVGGLKEVVGLAVFGSNLYWADAKTDGGLLSGINKMGSKSKPVQSRLKNLRDLVAVVSLNKSVRKRHPCSIDNGGCSHICVTEPDGSTRCSCPDHLKLLDYSLCVEPTTCEPKKFTCKRKQECVPLTWQCDNQKDCSDGTDEEDCPGSSMQPDCEAGQFSCGTLHLESSEKDSGLLHNLMETKAQCIDASLQCDGHVDCLNGQDENNCPHCKPGERTCANGKCVSAAGKCDVCKGAACGAGVSSPPDKTFLIVIGVVCGVAVLLGLLLYIRHCMTQNNNPYPPGVVMFTPNSNGQLNLNVAFQPVDDTNTTGAILQGGRKKQSSLNFEIVSQSNGNTSASHGTSRSDYYCNGRLVDRPSIPGASSHSSMKRQPKVNFDPSSETCSGVCGTCSSDVPSAARSTSYYRCKRGHRHRRSSKPLLMHGPPPPTPCTTDTCEDGGCTYRPSEAGSFPHEPPPPYDRHHSCCHYCYHQHNFLRATSSSSGSTSSRQCGEPPSYERHRSKKRTYYRPHFAGINSDTDPCPPPPTPRSQYLSECCETTEVEDVPDAEVLCGANAEKEDEDDETVILLESSSRRESPSITERSFSTLLDNPPPSPATDSS